MAERQIFSQLTKKKPNNTIKNRTIIANKNRKLLSDTP